MAAATTGRPADCRLTWIIINCVRASERTTTTINGERLVLLWAHVAPANRRQSNLTPRVGSQQERRRRQSSNLMTLVFITQQNERTNIRTTTACADRP